MRRAARRVPRSVAWVHLLVKMAGHYGRQSTIEQEKLPAALPVEQFAISVRVFAGRRSSGPTLAPKPTRKQTHHAYAQGLYGDFPPHAPGGRLGGPCGAG